VSRGGVSAVASHETGPLRSLSHGFELLRRLGSCFRSLFQRPALPVSRHGRLEAGSAGRLRRPPRGCIRGTTTPGLSHTPSSCCADSQGVFDELMQVELSLHPFDCVSTKSFDSFR